MVDVLTEIVINKPIGDVFEYSTNTDNVCKWYDNINYAEKISEGQLQLGSKIAFKASFMNKAISYTYEIIEFRPMTVFTMQTSQGPFPMRTAYEYYKINEKTTKMTIRNSGNPKGFSKIFSPIMEVMMKRANNKDLRKLKTMLEK